MKAKKKTVYSFSMWDQLVGFWFSHLRQWNIQSQINPFFFFISISILASGRSWFSLAVGTSGFYFMLKVPFSPVFLFIWTLEDFFCFKVYVFRFYSKKLCGRSWRIKVYMGLHDSGFCTAKKNQRRTNYCVKAGLPPYSNHGGQDKWSVKDISP